MSKKLGYTIIGGPAEDLPWLAFMNFPPQRDEKKQHEVNHTKNPAALKSREEAEARIRDMIDKYGGCGLIVELKPETLVEFHEVGCDYVLEGDVPPEQTVTRRRRGPRR